jgi:hydrogenase-1 operon protein HyaF
MTQEIANICNNEDIVTGLSAPILHEICQYYGEFCQNQTPKTISMRSLPLTKGDITQIDEYLGHGEVNITLNILGESLVWETNYSGIWRIRHKSGDRIISDDIEICAIPEILISHIYDIKNSYQQYLKNLKLPKLSKETEVSFKI